MLTEDRRLDLIRNLLEQRPATATEPLPGEREAAVALLLRPREQLELLLIRRARRDTDPWSGHVALPGGRREPHDLDLRQTAARETEEEVGIELKRVGQFLGRLDTVAPRTPGLPPLTIAPCVFAVPPVTEAVPDQREVDAAIWVPLPALRIQDAVSELLVELQDGTRSFPSLVYRDYVIWGLTHRILMQFLALTEEYGL